MATKKKSYKGKYPGPDRFKGDKKKLAAYRAAKKKAAAKPAAKPKPKPKPAPAAKPVNVYANPLNPAQNAANTASNMTGTIQLQTTADIENTVLQAQEEQKNAENEAVQMEQQAGITQSQLQEQARIAANQQRAQTNAQAAYRGLRGTSAYRKREQTEGDITQTNSAIAEQHRMAMQSASARRLQGKGALTAAEKWATLKRQEYTNANSATAPTAGSRPVNTGVRATPIANTAAAKAKAAAAKKTATKKKTYKGKYPGPDRFKGNAKKLAAYRAAKKKKAKK